MLFTSKQTEKQSVVLAGQTEVEVDTSLTTN